MTNEEIQKLKDDAISRAISLPSPEDQFVLLRALIEIVAEIALRLPEREFR